jgi:hypothetical protein
MVVLVGREDPQSAFVPRGHTQELFPSNSRPLIGPGAMARPPALRYAKWETENAKGAEDGPTSPRENGRIYWP